MHYLGYQFKKVVVAGQGSDISGLQGKSRLLNQAVPSLLMQKLDNLTERLFCQHFSLKSIV